MKLIVLFLLTALGALAQGPPAPPTTIFGTVRTLSGVIIDNPDFELIAVFADGVEIGRTPLEWDSEAAENYRFEIPNSSVVSAAVFSVKLVRDDQLVSLYDVSLAFAAFEPIQGTLVRFDFAEIIDTNNDGLPDSEPEDPAAPPTSIFGTVRDLAGIIIDDPDYEEIAIYLDGEEIGRVPLELTPGGDENYRFDIPNQSVLSRGTYSVKLLRDDQPVSIFEPDFELFLYQPIQGALKRFDFIEKPDADLDGIPDELETVDFSPEGDYDNDGLKDLQELAIDTDPTDWQSGINFEILGELPDGDFEVAFDVVLGHSYALEISSELDGWTEVSRLIAVGNTRMTVTTTPIPGSSIFWRVGVR